MFPSSTVWSCKLRTGRSAEHVSIGVLNFLRRGETESVPLSPRRMRRSSVIQGSGKVPPVVQGVAHGTHEGEVLLGSIHRTTDDRAEVEGFKLLLRKLTSSPKGGSKPTVNSFKDGVPSGAPNLNVLRGEAKFRNVGDSLGLRVRFLELVVECKEVPLAFRKPGEDNCSP